MTTVIVCDDQALIRSALVGLLEDAEDVSVLGEAGDGARAVELASRLRPDVVLMDIRMPGMDGIEATRRICADPALAETKVLILTTFEEDDYVMEALRAGASGFSGKGVEPERLLEIVRAVARGDELLSPQATKALISRLVRPRTAADPHPSELAELTEREVEVLRLVGQGLSNEGIAGALFISPHTAKTHVNRTMTKLGAHDRAQLVIVAYETGLVRPGR